MAGCNVLEFGQGLRWHEDGLSLPIFIISIYYMRIYSHVLWFFWYIIYIFANKNISLSQKESGPLFTVLTSGLSWARLPPPRVKELVWASWNSDWSTPSQGFPASSLGLLICWDSFKDQGVTLDPARNSMGQSTWRQAGLALPCSLSSH